MTNEELQIFINTWVRNSAVDAFTNLRLNTVLLQLVTGGITDTFDTYDDMKARIASNKADDRDWYMRAVVLTSPVGDNRIFEYLPALNQIFWTASQKYEQL